MAIIPQQSGLKNTLSVYHQAGNLVPASYQSHLVIWKRKTGILNEKGTVKAKLLQEIKNNSRKKRARGTQN